MIDMNFLRENPKKVKENLKKKFQIEKIPLIDEILKIDGKWRKLKYDEDKLRSERNKISKQIADEMKAGKKKEAEKLKKEAKKIPEMIEKTEGKRKKLEEEIKLILYKLPNIIHDSVPIGKDENENVEIKKFGEPKIPNYEIFNHAELAEKFGGVDFDTARKTSGNGFYYLRGDLSRLHSALISFAKDYMIEKGFEFIIPPFMIRSEVVDGVMSFQEKGNMMYKMEGEDLYLIGTSEHSLIGMFINKNLNGKNLPYKITGVSPCFRKEVGAHGIEEKGFYRVHQFEKQEMIVLCDPEESYEWYEKMLELSVEVFRQIGIPVRILECCSGDLADLKAKSADVEAWSPRQKKYFEVGSCSNLTDAQARRLNIRAEKSGKTYFVHTLNSTVIASPRALIALMENFQEKDGSIAIPKVLQPYMGGKKKIEMKK
ncbi:serine--tRNA ligase [Candidatus Pacearchaeota archaeon CG1_02_30_18]|nr:serine--tRNA ligase [Candidatus Pacearchaeota archaeon]OIO39971.1 MAG: serine--tRNA ligase [Candidatus Pacearchaeota archaeon CG1_02_30_18]PIN71605.1 MAG: serine--tRNA ligase [Candidatus Pacearchaeota archaeon CG11_big_fil_rev_8_21_14_0_20_30_13]PJA71333.1 MAG: serine--tRNA ligase [Candidatus Pacearchaeota archaeon CG_4_9_14_3_um_filter_30_11]